MTDRDVPHELAERIASAGEFTVDEVRLLREDVRQLRVEIAALRTEGAARHLELKPPLEAYADEQKELRTARNRTMAERAESRGKLEIFLTSKMATAIYAMLGTLFVGWLSERFGLTVPPPAAQEFADHADKH